MLRRRGRFPGKAANRIPGSAGGARRLALRVGGEGNRSAGAGRTRGARKQGRGGGEGPGTASGGISRGLEFWREFVEDGACCDRVSPGESDRWEPGKLRASPGPRLSARSETRARRASGGRGGGDACAERGGVWPCAARSAPPALRRGGSGCGARGQAAAAARPAGAGVNAAGRAGPAGAGLAPRAPPAPPPAGPASQPRAALFLGSPRAPPRPARAPAPGALSSPVAPRDSLPPDPLCRRLGRFVRPAAPRIPSRSPPRGCPSSRAPLLFPSLVGTSVTRRGPGARWLFFSFNFPPV